MDVLLSETGENGAGKSTLMKILMGIYTKDQGGEILFNGEPYNVSNPKESIHHEMIINMLVRCARRGMAVWIISSGIDEICEKTANEEFLKRLRYLA